MVYNSYFANANSPITSARMEFEVGKLHLLSDLISNPNISTTLM